MAYCGRYYIFEYCVQRRLYVVIVYNCNEGKGIVDLQMMVEKRNRVTRGGGIKNGRDVTSMRKMSQKSRKTNFSNKREGG